MSHGVMMDDGNLQPEKIELTLLLHDFDSAVEVCWIMFDPGGDPSS